MSDMVRLQRESDHTQRSRSDNYNSHGTLPVQLPRNASSLSFEGSVDPLVLSHIPSSDPSASSVTDEEVSSMGTLTTSAEETEKNSEYNIIDVALYEKLQHALKEAADLKREAHEESQRRRKAEMYTIEAGQKVKASGNFYLEEFKRRKGIEETLAKEKLELEKLKTQHNRLLEELQKANEQKVQMAQQIAESEQVFKDFHEKLSAAKQQLSLLQAEHEELQQQHEAQRREAEELRQKREETSTSTHRAMNFAEFTYSELKRATNNFDDSMKIGEGGYGSVYRGFLRHTMVAIKMLNSESRQGQTEFYQEVEILSQVRHPHLVTLVGTCLEVWALIYEYLPQGSLEDHLVCKDNTHPLPWYVRTRILADICSALIFLHTNKPHAVVHGDLKPANILLDPNFVSKIGDFGIGRFLVHSNSASTLCKRTHPKGTFAYMDPEFVQTGDLTPHSDVYSFGVVILRLLTGRPALGIQKDVKEAMEAGRLHEVLDVSAGEWPFVHAKKLAQLALKCCEIKRKNRPDLARGAWRVFEPMLKAISSMELPSGNSSTPSYFICPLSQEIMMDPQVAADGFTYEAEAIKGWLDGGLDTSPMTNLKLAHNDLVPNLALRSAIQEWLQKQK